MRKVIIFSIVLIAIIASTIIYLSISKRKLLVTGFALDGDAITVTINEKEYLVQNFRNADRSKLHYLYEELEYRSLRYDDSLHIELESDKGRLIDTNIVLSNKNIQPRVFFENPYLTSHAREVSLVSDSGLIQY
jgi:hypothetical protein